MRPHSRNIRKHSIWFGGLGLRVRVLGNHNRNRNQHQNYIAPHALAITSSATIFPILFRSVHLNILICLCSKFCSAFFKCPSLTSKHWNRSDDRRVYCQFNHNGHPIVGYNSWHLSPISTPSSHSMSHLLLWRLRSHWSIALSILFIQTVSGYFSSYQILLPLL